MNARLAIDYGAVSTRAVLAWPDGRATVLAFDGGFALSSAVHVSRAAIAVGAEAWRHAATDPDGLVISPLRVGTGEITVNGRLVGVAELVAATLRAVAGETTRVAGHRVDDVFLVVPAGWGPRRRTWLRHAAREAGLPLTRLIDAPVAAAAHLTTAPGRPVLVIDLGGGCEATVLQPGPSGLEVLSTLADPDAGGDRIDADLTTGLVGSDLSGLPADQRWTVLADVRATKHALSDQIAVTMPVPGGNPPMVINAAQVARVAQPVFERAGKLAAAAVGNADVKVDQLGAVYLIGGAAATPGAAQTITDSLGATVQPAAQPELVAVRAAAGTGQPLDAAEQRLALPPWWRLVTLGLPGLFSLLLYAHFVFSADFNNGRPDAQRPGYYVLASWGELAVAGVLATITCLQAGTLFAVLLDHQAPPTQARVDTGTRIATGLGLAAAAGLAATSLYAVTAAVYFGYPITDLLRWALLPSLPTSLFAAALAALAWRHHNPAAGWDTFLAFPLISVATAAAGTIAVALWWHGGLPWWANSWVDPIGYVGGVLVGVGVACALTRHLVARIALAVLLGLFLLIISRTGPGIPAIIYAVAASAWWASRTWSLARTTPAAVNTSGPS